MVVFVKFLTIKAGKYFFLFVILPLNPNPNFGLL